MNPTTFRYKLFDLRTDDTYNVKIRVYHKGVELYRKTDLYADKCDVENGRIKEGTRMLKKVNDLVIKYRDIFGMIIGTERMGARELAEAIEREIKTQRDMKTFNEFTLDMVRRMELKGRTSTGKNYLFMLNSIKRFYDGPLLFSDIDVRFLRNYEDHLRTSVYYVGKHPRRTGERGISLYMGLIRAVFNEAIREYNFTKEFIVSPFDHGRYRIPTEPQPKKRSLQPKHLVAIRDSNPNNKRAIQSRDIFMLSFYLMGMNAADLYSCTYYKDGRITYNRQKTASRRKDKALFSVLVPEEAKEIIERYRDPKGVRVFNFYNRYSTLNNFNRALRFGLQQIESQEPFKSENIHLEFYAARHTWATIARNDCRVDKLTVHEGLNHSGGMDVTDGYIGRTWDILDETNRKVLDFVKTYPCE